MLRTWGQTLTHHPHLHCVVPAGGFAPDGNAWVQPKTAGFFLPKSILGEVFRGKFQDGLKSLFRRGKLALHGSLAWLAEPRAFAQLLRLLHRHEWVVDVRKPFGGPEHVLLSGPVHTSGRYFQPPAHQPAGRQGHVSLERLCPWRQEAEDDTGSRTLSCCTCFPRAWPAFANTVGWPTVIASSAPSNASPCWRQIPCPSNRRRRKPHLPGAARDVEASSRQSRSSCRGIRFVAGVAGDVDQTAHRESHLPTSHPGRSARMPAVCSSDPIRRAPSLPVDVESPISASRATPHRIGGHRRTPAVSAVSTRTRLKPHTACCRVHRKRQRPASNGSIESDAA